MEKQEKLNPRQKKFCKLWATDKEFFANGTSSYGEAYEIDISTKDGYNTAKSSACKLLTIAYILLYINKLLERQGLNDEFVDKQLLFLMNQMVDFKTKLGAIKEYNQLRARILKRLDVTSGGKVVQSFNFIAPNGKDNSDNKTPT